jgi:hypothetical protein
MPEEVKPAAGTPEGGAKEVTQVTEPKTAAAVTEQKTEAPKTEVSTAKEPEKAAPVVPEKYDLKPAEGSRFKGELLDGLVSEAKEMKLTNEEAQAFLESKERALSAFVDHQVKQWDKEAKADKEIGGEKYAKSIEASRRVLRTFLPEHEEETLSFGSGVDPKWIKLLTRVAERMADDKFVQAPNSRGQGNKSIAERMYPNSPQ